MTDAEQPPPWQVFHRAAPDFRRIVATLVDRPDGLGDAAAAEFEAMVPGMAYADTPEHPMAASVYFCSVALAFYLAGREHGLDVHAFGSALLAAMAADPPPAPAATDAAAARRQRATFRDAAAASQRDARPGEFVFEAVSGRDQDFDWGMNVTACAICHAFARHDAMALVPYMCASDDVVSEHGRQGLRRTGTIALGSHRCDFRYHHGQPTEPLAARYPEKIRLQQETDR